MHHPARSELVSGAFHQLHQKITTGTASVTVVGQGYVGLTVASAAAVSGMTVNAIDTSIARVRALANGQLTVPGVSPELFAHAYATGRLRFDSDFSPVAESDVILLCVPTPLADHRPDLSFVESAARAIAHFLTRSSLVVLESTTYAGTTEQVLRPILEGVGLKDGEDFLLAYSPERVDPGNVKYDLRTTPRIVGGTTSEAAAAAARFYGRFVDEVHALTNCRAAEMAKLLENTFRMVNIALVNELAMLCADQNVDVWEVISAAATKPFGFMPFYPGPGVGGHCIPLDPTYLAWQARRETGRRFRLVETAQDINDEMPSYVAGRIIDALNERGVSVRNARILVLGVTYKPDVGDIRESAAVAVVAKLLQRGADVTYHDPFVDEITVGGTRLTSAQVTPDTLRAADCVALLTPHHCFDLDQITAEAPFIFDSRNAIPMQSPEIAKL
jgi:UDP-N-acetyl-D-glucosamine dehydrogenase